MPQHDPHPFEPPRAILVGVHLHDEDGGLAVATAAAYAAAFGAELILTGLAPIAEPAVTDAYMALSAPSAPPIAEQQMLDRIARERLDEAAAAVPEGVPTRTVLDWGRTGVVLAETAELEGAGLIVVPMHREGALAHLLHDGDDRYVLHHATVPVLVVPVPARVS
jgi:nucleotide-binding universal stress UspA family protein